MDPLNRLFSLPWHGEKYLVHAHSFLVYLFRIDMDTQYKDLWGSVFSRIPLQHAPRKEQAEVERGHSQGGDGDAAWVTHQ